MIQRKTQDQLIRLNRSIPERLQRSLIRTTVDNSQEEIVKEILRKKQLSKATRKELKKALDEGSLRMVEKVADPQVTKKIDQYLDKKIRNEIRMGRLEPAKHDAFTRKMQKLMKPKEV